jgi:hypothetical protein
MVRVPGDDADVRFEVTAPAFARVLGKGVRVQKTSPTDSFLVATVEMAIDTATPGERTGELVVTLGASSARVPVTARVRPRRSGLTRVLVAQSPFCPASTNNSADFAGWTGVVTAAGLDVSYLLPPPAGPMLRDLDLGRFDCVLLGMDCLRLLDPRDVRRVRAFAVAGGRVVVAASYYAGPTVEKANAVLDGYGLSVRDKEGFGKEKEALLGKDDLDPGAVKAGVGSAYFFRGSPVRVADGQSGRVLVKASGVGQPGDGFVATATAGKGEVIVIGHAVWWHWVSESGAKGTDNAKLLGWLITRSRAE